MRLLVSAILAASGCLSPSHDALLICHNANCAASSTVSGDDLLPSLDASLALRTAEGRVVFDGIELDSVWNRAQKRCTFAHGPDPGAADFATAAQRVVTHVASAPPGAAGYGSVLYFKIELKVDVGDGASHTPEERAAHIACVTAAAHDAIRAGAASHNIVVPIFDSDDPTLLAAIDPAPFGGGPSGGCLFETDADVALPPGFAPQIFTLAWFDLSDDAAASLRTPALRTETGRNDHGLAVWARSPSPQDIYAMLLHDPRFLVVNNVEEARGVLTP